MPEPIYRRAAELMEADVGNELVALDVQAGTCFGFNEVATAIWRLLEQPRSATDLCTLLGQEYEVPPDECRRDIDELIADLRAKRLVTAA